MGVLRSASVALSALLAGRWDAVGLSSPAVVRQASGIAAAANGPTYDIEHITTSLYRYLFRLQEPYDSGCVSPPNQPRTHMVS